MTSTIEDSNHIKFKDADTSASNEGPEPNQSIITAVSAPLDPTPTTSPLVTNTNVFQRDKFHEAVKSRGDEMIQLLKHMCSGVSESVELGESFDWRKILEVSELIFNDYSKTMEEITKEFDELNRDFLIWQESAYIIDSEKVAKRLGSQEQWINWKQQFLKYTNEELLKSAGLIDEAIKKLK